MAFMAHRLTRDDGDGKRRQARWGGGSPKSEIATRCRPPKRRGTTSQWVVSQPCSASDLARSRNGERTPPACQFGRRARTIVTPSSCAWRWEEVCGTRFSARRRKPHVRGVCSPELGAASSFDFGVRVRTSVPLRQHPVQHLRQPLRGESAMALQPQERTDFSWRTRHRPRQLHIVEA